MKYWKYIIIGLLVGMMAFHFSALFYIRNQKYELTSPDYYEREIQHQQVLDALRRGHDFNWNLVIQADKSQSYLEVTDPNGANIVIGKLKLEFYRPHNSSQDHHLQLDPGQDGRYYFDAVSLPPGRWDWMASGSFQGETVAFQKRISLP